MVFREPKWKALDDDLERLQRYLRSWLNFRARKKIDRKRAIAHKRATPEGRAKIRADRRRHHKNRMLRDPIGYRLKRNAAKRLDFQRHRVARLVARKIRIERLRQKDPETFLKKRREAWHRHRANRIAKIKNLFICERLAAVVEREANIASVSRLYTMQLFKNNPIYRKAHLSKNRATWASNAKKHEYYARWYDKHRRSQFTKEFGATKKLYSQLLKETNNVIKTEREYQQRIECEQLKRRIVDHIAALKKQRDSTADSTCHSS